MEDTNNNDSLLLNHESNGNAAFETDDAQAWPYIGADGSFLRKCVEIFRKSMMRFT